MDEETFDDFLDFARVLKKRESRRVKGFASRDHRVKTLGHAATPCERLCLTRYGAAVRGRREL
jgi:hypothetical protein